MDIAPCRWLFWIVARRHFFVFRQGYAGSIHGRHARLAGDFVGRGGSGAQLRVVASTQLEKAFVVRRGMGLRRSHQTHGFDGLASLCGLCVSAMGMEIRQQRFMPLGDWIYGGFSHYRHCLAIFSFESAVLFIAKTGLEQIRFPFE